MSQENVEVVLQATDAVNRRDRDAFVACLHPDVVWDDTAGFPGVRGVHRGRAEAQNWFEDVILEPWKSLHLEVEQQGNIENIRRGFDAWNRSDLDGWLACFAPEAELHTTARFVDQGVYRGRPGLERYWAELHEAAEEISISIPTCGLAATGCSRP